MLAVEEWAQKHNPVIAFFAISHALFAREKCKALRNVKERSIYAHKFPLPELTPWFAMYHSRKPVLAYKRLISNTSDFSNELMSLFVEFRKFEKALKRNPDKFNLNVTPQELKEAFAYWQELCSKIFEEIREDISGTPLNTEIQDKFDNALVKDELSLSFYFLVYSPCHLFYGISSTVLYRNALNRDIDAIEKLLKLDPLIIHDPEIGFQIQSIRLYGKTNDYERILAAITKQPKINYKMITDERRSIKSDHGAQIYILAKTLRYPLQVPQIRGLFDALARDYEGTLDDTDIKKPEGFDKTIKTKAATWQKIHQASEKQK
ncbi:hypothetical protein [Geobacter sp. AOG1]|uniref:hypothetical protein n=1 Tax=Geobacter sp. AOG1 TaxID=1566346 RepID=UPI001CC47765|nr:hypothetical protein [Geobacter sp. AOG1]GFE58201.1 hypothetical protein AOG1_20810 [Geobacter sp. AOG1]